MPSCSIKETNKCQKAIHSRKAAVRDFQEVNVEPEDEEYADDLEELDELIPEQTEYINSLDLIDKLVKIKVSELFDYVKDRTDEAFSYDFQSIPTAFQMPCLFARSPENKTSNRYKGIMPYDHSRVQIDGQPDFYINASYIDGYKRQKAYIACLGPTAATHDNFKTFWKMVWHKKVEIIVMVTNLNEPSGMKCEQYWPDVSQDEDYGDVHVSCQNIQIFADYTLRTFKVINNTEKGDVCRRLVHLHYTSWPDKKTPEDVISLLEFRQKYRDVKTSLNGPIIVHCSAGIGRTGVFIAVDRLIMEGNREGTVNVPACLNKMREQRVKMVQTSEQYKFIFKALVYALCLNCELIPIENIEEHVNDTDENSMNRQYKELEFSLERNVMDDMNSESEYENLTDKGRPGADILDNPNRVCLYLNRAFKDTDFINAVYVHSYKWKDHFIMAQSPLPASVTDFVTMIYQENCSCIVSMDDINESGTVVNKYLPAENESLEKGGFIVSCFAFDTKPHYTVRKVTIKNKENSNDERDYYHFQYKKWTAGIDVPVRAEDFVDFVKDVEEYATLSKENAHVLVHCLNGNKRSGIFCAVAIIMEKLLYDQQVSVMNTLRQLKKRRPYAITGMEQMMFCYQAARAIVQMHRKNCIRYDHLL
ncbi:receptor-type tyrosine-protein phosphatase alpha-like [Ruditapes philippinarum]|uniref:receptor-type tyrosine-protein phosphatase alpha-like n=1 Tax=Ruditapes philippinarum TaxID=129788 RepID=UPI00295C129B|nr:receptor-type tyrosine-protein phosphatase alpha-like [Ruditapes philippinarum]